MIEALEFHFSGTSDNHSGLIVLVASLVSLPSVSAVERLSPSRVIYSLAVGVTEHESWSQLRVTILS